MFSFPMRLNNAPECEFHLDVMPKSIWQAEATELGTHSVERWNESHQNKNNNAVSLRLW